jgi:transposase
VPTVEPLPAHLPREIVEVAIPEDTKKRIQSGEMILIRQSIRESLKFVPLKLVVVEYKEPVLAFAHSPEKEILVEGEVNLGDKGRYHPSVAAQVVHGKFGLHLPYYRTSYSPSGIFDFFPNFAVCHSDCWIH